MIDRREFSAGTSAMVGLLATQVSACQPSPIYDPTGKGLQQALASKSREALRRLFDQSATLSVIDAKSGIKVLTGPASISEYLFDLIYKEGYHFAPSVGSEYKEYDEELSWRSPDEFGWQKASVWRYVDENLKVFVLEGCGEVHTDSFNILLSGSPIQSVAVIRAQLPEELKQVALEHDEAVAKKANPNG